MIQRQKTTFSTLAATALAASILGGCGFLSHGVNRSDLSSGAPNVFDFEWSCATLQDHFVNFGNKFDAAIADYNAGDQTTNTTHTFRGELAQIYRGVPLASPWQGRLTPLFSQLVLPDGIVKEADCLRDVKDEAKYDACVEAIRHYTTLKSVANAWDNNSNGKKCYEGASYQRTDVIDFAYCDNECAFNDRSCTRCEVPSRGGKSRAFVCKSKRTAVEAVGAWCRMNDGKCPAFNEESMCQTKPGIEFSGQGLRAVDGTSQHRGTYELNAWLGAYESVQVKAGVAAGKKVAARGTLKGRVLYTASTIGSDTFTRTGITTPGTRITCGLIINRIADISFNAEAGVGADFLLAGGQVMVEAGGSFNFNKEFSKTSATWSAAGQTEDMIVEQCVNNYVKRWVTVELTKYLEEYPGLEIIQKTVHRIISDSGMDAKFGINDTSGIFCRYPSYDATRYYRTAGVQLFVEDSIKVQWGHMRHLFFDSLWPDAASEKLPVDEEALRPYVRGLKDGTLRGQRLADFFNSIVVPASRAASDPRWSMDRCYSQN
jgi:hypothetical protein